MRRIRMLLLATLIAASAGLRAEPVAQSPWLQASLPDGTLMYARVPSLFALLSAPKGNALDAALRDSRHEAIVTRIERGLIETLFGPDGVDAPMAQALLSRLRSPIEVAVLGAPRPLAVVAVTTDLRDEAALSGWLSQLATPDAPLALGAPLDAEGQAPLTGLPAPVWLDFNARNGRLMLVSGQVIDADIMAGVAPRLTGGNASLADMAARLDQSGFGALVWLNAEDALPMAQVMLPPEQYARLAELGVENTRAVALGMGIANGQARLGVLADLGERNASPIPVLRNRFDAEVVGQPSAIVTFGLPSTAQVRNIVELTAGPDAWPEFQAGFEREAGFSFDLLLDAFGPDASVVFDDVGDYLAIGLRDRKAFDALIEAARGYAGTRYSETRRGRVRVVHLSFADAADIDEAEVEAAFDADTQKLMKLVSRFRDHVYYVIDGDYLYVADVPQPLIDRGNARRRTRLADWLSETQKVDFSSSALGFTVRAEKLPRRIYYVYLALLQAMADLADAEIDLMALPTARELGLESGSPVALNLSLGEPYVGIELTSTSSAFDAFLGGGAMQSAVVAGIVAAIAIPAYQDYTIRAQVSEAISLGEPVKAWLTERYFVDGVLPDASALSEAPAPIGRYVVQTVVFPDTGVIRMTFGNEANLILYDQHLYLAPVERADGSLGWECSSWLDDKYLPSICQGIEPPLDDDAEGI